jgi:hypothetical protein
MTVVIVICAVAELFLLQFFVALVRESRKALRNQKGRRSTLKAGNDADLTPATLYSGERSCRI